MTRRQAVEDFRGYQPRFAPELGMAFPRDADDPVFLYRWKLPAKNPPQCRTQTRSILKSMKLATAL
jgi:hypothetical protein